MNALMHRNASGLAALRAASAPASLNHPFKTSIPGSVIATEAPDGDVLATIDTVIRFLTEARKALNVDKPHMPTADGLIEDAWHVMRRIDTTTWGDAS